MGISLGFSSFCDHSSNPVSQEPDLTKFTVLWTEEVGRFCIASVRYHNAKNYMGQKLLLFEATEKSVLEEKKLDPHFCEDIGHLSPVARFEPTMRGEGMLRALLRSLHTTKKGSSK